MPLEGPLKEKRNWAAISLGTNMVVGMTVFTFLGSIIDEKLAGESQVFTLVGIFLGLFYCGYEVWKLIRQNSEK